MTHIPSPAPIHDPEGLPFRVSLEAVNRAVGLVALGLPLALLLVGKRLGACPEIDSISHYYFTRLGGDIFVGSLFLIGILLMFFYRMPAPVDGYLGHRPADIWLARFAGLCAFGIALAPAAGSGCEDYAGSAARLFLSGATGAGGLDLARVHEGAVLGHDFWGSFGVTGGALPYLHYASALGMFTVLGYFSLVVFRRRQSVKSHLSARRKRNRNRCYLLCGLVIAMAILALVVKAVSIGETSPAGVEWNRLNLTYWFEAAALLAFGLSWSVKGRVFRIFRDRDEPDLAAQARAAYSATAAAFDTLSEPKPPA